jgi:hypothetical protein
MEQAEQDFQESTARTGLPEQNCQNRTTRTRLLEKTARMELPGQCCQPGQDKKADSQNRTARTRQPERDSHKTGQLELGKKNGGVGGRQNRDAN